jgi:hypothetical protein
MAPKDGFKPGHGGGLTGEPVLTEVPDGIPRHRGDGRPWIRKPGDRDPAPAVVREGDRWVLADQRHDAKRGAYYGRASSIRDLEDEYRLTRWKIRTAVQGMSRDPGLLATAQSWPLVDDNDPTLRDRWDTLADRAIDAGKGGVGAAQGTGFHLLTERRDRGEDLGYLPDHLRRALDSWDRIMGLFEILGTEQFVVWDDAPIGAGIGGTYDRFLCPRQPIDIVHPKTGLVLDTITPDETIIGDLKSGRTAHYFGPKYLMQQLPYARGVPYSHKGGRGEWPGGRRPNQRWAVIPHVHHGGSGEFPEPRLYWVNLARAEQAFQLTQALRAFRKLDDLFLLDPEDFGPGIPGAMHKLGLVGLLRNAETSDVLDELWDEYGTGEVWDDDCDRIAKVRYAELQTKGRPE